MSKFAIGDVQGHYDSLMRLLDKLDFSELWFVGDLVNRGSQSLEVVRFLMQLRPAPKIVLGNHDLYLLRLLFNSNAKRDIKDTLEPILRAPDRDEIADWFRRMPYLIENKDLNVVMTHAGIAPCWTMDEARIYAQELFEFSQTDEFFNWMHLFNYRGAQQWNNNLIGLERIQLLSDYFTRMRFTDRLGHLDWSSNQTLLSCSKSSYPWFACPTRQHWRETIVFGHWAALMGKTGLNKIQAIDTGCHWGGPLTALNLENFQRFSSI